MFKRAIDFFRDIRIKLNFPEYEKKCRLEHERRADRIHAIGELEVEARSVVRKIEVESDHLFQMEIAKLRGTVSSMGFKISNHESLLRILTRNYKQDIDALYEEKNTLFSEKEELYASKNALSAQIQAAFSEKSAAHEALNRRKASIDSWYAKSDRTPWLFGNGGKKLPKNSLFGQSFSDLESLKSDRDSAFEEVKRCVEAISDLKREQQRLGDLIGRINVSIGALVEDINQVKNERTRMFELKNEGVREGRIRAELRDFNESLINEQRGLASLVGESIAFITSEKHRRGVIDLEAQIQRLKDRKLSYLKEFDLDVNRELRVAQHRQNWLKERGLA
jgi:hypothetical protein